MKQFEPIQAMKLPYVFDGDNIRGLLASDQGVKQGFWTKLLLKGSGCPVARENATMMPTLEFG